MRKLLALLAPVLIFVGACERDPPHYEDGVFFPTWSEDARPSALLTGTLAQQGPCLVLEDERGGAALLLWEDEYSYRDGAVVDASGRAVVRVGDPIIGGGGFLSSDRPNAESLIGQRIPQRCVPPGDEPFAMIYDVGIGLPSKE